MAAPSTTVKSVADLIAKRNILWAQRARLEVAPGLQPLIGVATADECATWKTLGHHIAWCDEQLAEIGRVVSA